jgi:hypothetical protein
MDKCDFANHEAHTVWGTPCWKNADDYLFVQSLAGGKLRWEFLRRLPAYRNAWRLNGEDISAYGLRKLVDPSLDYRSISPTQEVELSTIEGKPLASVVPYLRPSDEGSPNALELKIGKRVLRLLDSGYVLFVTHPQVSATRQASDIEKQLSMWQKEISKSESPDSHRLNAPRKYSLNNLLRVLDAYWQENVLEGKPASGVKKNIGFEIFRTQKQYQSSKEIAWHKHAESAYRQARNIALSPAD